MKSYKGIFLGALVALLIAACGVQTPRAQSLEDVIATTAATIESTAQQVRELCGNSVPDGACRAGALIDTDTKNDLKATLQESVDALKLSTLALSNDQRFEASDHLARADAALSLVRDALARRLDQ